ncbi:tRNA wybutosine-synthesis-related protein 4 [Parastagonospora nodorum]|uniref:tRNA wybutosine-synthesis-related protein 4 n=1 Tax=Phaeosphaeria nodorum (strain SN15 / ATCC MYA-4574 / FGSC 10173) TaxID=321614 RepID=A0A7U2I1C0_PHANO|nr:tRNA wybutosine-synthesis-related protein 4 [Parastagonospora nodorum]QRC99660.1 tRNA wybutosine-synthesis-related protein 4 [Parastagonospora nodorum SN15]KAH3923617.1 tRNA wybutosine-synthesis-related protein 4 [Parastagonospora nodorum]KAH3941570.1 tRNA wybutosine-synthesis-related protein 4 [Parastagonospora nodorum]KAH3965256.1 tRNA wybutosine-synthesis-related protein 4 [Parastagonospora nodorum]
MRAIARVAGDIHVPRPPVGKVKKIFEPPRCYLTKESIREKFNPNIPARFKRLFKNIPAYDKWFEDVSGTWDEVEPEPVVMKNGKMVTSTRKIKDHLKRKQEAESREVRSLNMGYLKQFGDTVVPLERTTIDQFQRHTFERFNAPLSLLLEYMMLKGAAKQQAPKSMLYLAQQPLGELPQQLQDDLPQPEMLKILGKGDIYASSLWMGGKGSKTPLHRDPNPNLLVHLCGKKIVRLVRPDIGKEMYENVKARLGREGGSANMRGEEMMQGEEMAALETEIWGREKKGDETIGIEVELKKGDGLYIPLGWWHAVRNTAKGPNVSVNWWFR